QAGFQARPVVGGTFALDTLRYIPNGLTGYWPFGGSPLDASGNRNDLSLTGGARYALGGLGGALLLDGAGAHAQSGRPVIRTDGSFTVMAWVRMSGSRGTGTAVSQDGTEAPGFSLQYSAARNRWAFTMAAADAAGSAVARALSARPAAAGSWVHLAGVRDAAAGRIRLFVNGIHSGTAAYSGAWHASGRFQVGRGLRH